MWVVDGKIVGPIFLQTLSRSTWRLSATSYFYFVLEPPLDVKCSTPKGEKLSEVRLNQIRFSFHPQRAALWQVLVPLKSSSNTMRGSRCDICDDEIGKRLAQQSFLVGSDTCKQATWSIGQTTHFTLGQQHCLGPVFFEIGGHHFLWAYFVIEYRQNNLPWKSWGSQKQQIIKGHTGPQGSSRFVLSHTHKPMFHIAVVETRMSHMSILRFLKTT